MIKKPSAEKKTASQKKKSPTDKKKSEKVQTKKFVEDFRGRVIYGNYFQKTDNDALTVEKKPIPKKEIFKKITLSKKDEQRKKKLQSDRNKLYAEKSKLLKKYFDDEDGIGFEKGDALKVLKKLNKLSEKIEDKTDKLSNYYVTNLKKKAQKKSWQRRINYLKKNYDKLDDKSKLSVISEISSIQDIITDLDFQQGKPIEKVKAQIKSVFDENSGEISEDIAVWQATDRVMDIIRTGNYKTIDVSGEIYDTFSLIAIKWQLDELYISITTNPSRKFRTPFVTITINDTTKHITVYEARY